MTTFTSTASTTVNTTATELISDTDDSDGWIESPTPRIVFLSVFISFGFFGNLFLIITVCQSRKFRSIAFFIFVIHLAVINLCECVLNMSVLLASSIINEWKFGELACRLSSFCLNLIAIQTVLSLTISTADRLIAVRYKERYEHVVSTPRIAILISFTWLQSFSFSVPIAVGVVPTSVNSYIVYCAISTNSSVVYTIFSIVLCFIVPFVLMIVFFVKIIRTGYSERFHIRNIIAQHNYNDESAEEPRIKQDFRHANLTGTICIAWLILESPHVVTSYFNQLQNSSEGDSIEREDLQYVWYVDLVLLWLRFCYAMALPIASFTWSKDLWKSFKDMILCRKNNSIVDESFKKNDSDTLRLEKKIREERMKEKEAIISPREQRVFQVPVLFATSHGVHIQTSNSQTEISDDDEVENEQSKSTINGTLRGKKCDVIGSRDNLNNMEEDTSDYDSGNELDPFSVSHPISVKQINKENLTDRKRSLSEPEVRDKIQALDKSSNGRSVGSTSEGDSGLDLSTLTNVKTSKKLSVFHVPSDKLVLHNTNDQLQTEIMQSGFVPPSLNISGGEKNNVYAEFPDQDKAVEDDTVLKSKESDLRFECEKGEGIKSNTKSSKKSPEKSLSGATESPIPRRKKKRRKEKNFDTQSITSATSIAGIPPRPPPRLAPITTIKTLAYGPVRPGSSCSSQVSFTDSNMDGRQSVLSCNSCGDITKPDAMSLDNLSVSSLNTRKHKKSGKFKQNLLHETFSNHLLNENEILTLDLKREIKSVPEEVLTPSDCNFEDRTPETHKLYPETGIQTTETGIVNTGYEQCSNDDTTNAIQEETRIRNNEARRKRREKLMSTKEKISPSVLLNDGKGYQRLVPETP
ncbi:uncharacterized protein LOC123546614 [Mercenaria mercenaria]|uniref:uncharacterized protein LOC123546614 n=1 Tax=Mercenaria mercenaria TaxID=6596 RepID=UPI00234E9347|nr:uncharacterized protein LOC123546614 [Mercenaria mercenaria]XP_045188979.2 uncharacterized protein LOC123546614 [Mercenaria mercenaria]XP_053406909.1 uncharacterized protein LOC123546614 [Mercenaria mercenaria]